MDNKFNVQVFKPRKSKRETSDLKYKHNFNVALYMGNNVEKGIKKNAQSLVKHNTWENNIFILYNHVISRRKS